MWVLLLLTCDVTFQLDFGMTAFGVGGEIGLKLLRGLKELYFQNPSSENRGGEGWRWSLGMGCRETLEQH